MYRVFCALVRETVPLGRSGKAGWGGRERIQWKALPALYGTPPLAHSAARSLIQQHAGHAVQSCLGLLPLGHNLLHKAVKPLAVVMFCNITKLVQ